VGVDHTPTCTRNREEKEIMTNENRDHAENHEDQAALEGHPRDELDRLVDEITREPWFEALKSLTDWSGLWVGTEEDLMEELKKRTAEVQAGDVDVASEDFPSSASEIIEPPQDVDWAMRKERLSITDYRTMEKDLRENYDVPGWGRKAPILLQRGLAGLRPSRDGALFYLSQYGNPLAASVVLFTYIDSKFKSKERRWSGSTAELAQQLSFYPVKINNDMERHEQIWKVLRLERRADHRRFSAMMKTCAYILKDVEVKVTWKRITGRNSVTDEKYVYTRWTVEAPNWAPWRPPSS
jgi:hypothetical protein